MAEHPPVDVSNADILTALRGGATPTYANQERDNFRNVRQVTKERFGFDLRCQSPFCFRKWKEVRPHYEPSIRTPVRPSHIHLGPFFLRARG